MKTARKIKLYVKTLLVGIICMVSGLSASADNKLTVNAGFLFPSTLNASIGYEYPFSYGKAFEAFGEIGNHWKSGQGQFWKGYYWDGGILYKHQLKRFKNANFRFRGGPIFGATERKFFLGLEAGFEYNYIFASGVEFSIIQKNNVCFLHGDLFKNGLLLGVTIPF
ncbi:MAG: hypothetical protein HDS87_04980 [Bacteroidales bacterium]|nr:hypothetical protein [Bacteroidales bacterium]